MIKVAKLGRILPLRILVDVYKDITKQRHGVCRCFVIKLHALVSMISPRLVPISLYGGQLAVDGTLVQVGPFPFGPPPPVQRRTIVVVQLVAGFGCGQVVSGNLVPIGSVHQTERVDCGNVTVQALFAHT